MARNFGFPGRLLQRGWIDRRRWGVIFGVGLLICGATATGVNYSLKQNARLWVVNGLPTGMLMKFDDERELYVSEQSFRSFTLPEGRHRVVINSPELSNPAEEFELRNAWWERFLYWRQPMHVLSPGRTAVIALARERQEEPGQAVTVVSRDLVVGRFFATYHDIDLPFLDFPSRERGDAHTGPLEKTLLYVHREHPKLVVNSQGAAAHSQPRDILSFAEAQLMAAPSEGGLLSNYMTLSLELNEGDRCLGFLEKKLSHRPLWHDWHLVYQYVADRLGRRHEVVHQYDAFLERESRNQGATYSGLLYLRGRLEQDDDRQLNYMQQAVTAHPGNYFAWYNQGFVRLAQGRLKEAEAGLRNAYLLHASRPPYRDNYFEVAIALGHGDVVRRNLDREIEGSRMANLDQQRLLLAALIAADDLDALPYVQSRFAQYANDSQPGDPIKLALQSQLHQFYLQAEFDKILDQSVHLENPRLRHQALFELGRLKELPRQPSLLDVVTPRMAASQHLLLCVAWSQLNDTENAAAEMQEAIRALRQGTPDQRLLADFLVQPNRATLAELQGVTVSPTQKAIALIALVQRGATPRKELLELATQLNYSRQFPHHFLKRTMGSLLSEGAGKRS